MPLLPNRYGEAMTRFGAFRQIKKLAQRASMEQPALNRTVSPHLFRHASSAMRLLEAGIAPEVIALWLAGLYKLSQPESSAGPNFIGMF